MLCVVHPVMDACQSADIANLICPTIIIRYNVPWYEHHCIHISPITLTTLHERKECYEIALAEDVGDGLARCVYAQHMVLGLTGGSAQRLRDFLSTADDYKKTVRSSPV